FLRRKLKNTRCLLAIAVVFLGASPVASAQDAASTPFRHKRSLEVKEVTASSTIAIPTPISATELGERLRLEAIPSPTLEPIASPLPNLSDILGTPTPEAIAAATLTPKPQPPATPSPQPT